MRGSSYSAREEGPWHNQSDGRRNPDVAIPTWLNSTLRRLNLLAVDLPSPRPPQMQARSREVAKASTSDQRTYRDKTKTRATLHVRGDVWNDEKKSKNGQSI